MASIKTALSKVKNKGKRLWLLPIFTGLLAGVAFYKYQLGLLSLFALLPLLHFLSEAKKSKLSWRRFVLTIWGGGFVFFLIYLSWMLDIQPASWAAIDGAPAAIGVGFCWLASSLVFSLGFLAFGFLVYLLPGADPRKGQSIIIIPAIWIVCEFARSWLYSLAAWGPEATIGAHWNFGNLGFAASATPFSSLSKLIGLYGLSFAVVAINILLFWLLIKKKALLSATILAAMAAMALVTGVLYKPGDKNLTIGAAQIDKYSGGYADSLARQIQSTTDSHAKNPELLVLPEESRFYYLPLQEQSAVLYAAFGSQQGYVITTDVEKDGEKSYAALQYFDTQNGLLGSQQKTFLIPIGEYLPKVVEGLLHLTTSSNVIDSYKDKRLHNKGHEPVYPIGIGDTKVGALACSGVISPELYRSLSRQNAEVLVNSASLDIFSHSQVYYEQAKQMARFQAVANNKAFVQATMGGYSYIIDSNGRFIEETKNKETGYVQASIRANQTKTLYVIFGEFVLVISLALVTWLIIKRVFL